MCEAWQGPHCACSRWWQGGSVGVGRRQHRRRRTRHYPLHRRVVVQRDLPNSGCAVQFNGRRSASAAAHLSTDGVQGCFYGVIDRVRQAAFVSACDRHFGLRLRAWSWASDPCTARNLVRGTWRAGCRRSRSVPGHGRQRWCHDGCGARCKWAKGAHALRVVPCVVPAAAAVVFGFWHSRGGVVPVIRSRRDKGGSAAANLARLRGGGPSRDTAIRQNSSVNQDAVSRDGASGSGRPDRDLGGAGACINSNVPAGLGVGLPTRNSSDADFAAEFDAELSRLSDGAGLFFDVASLLADDGGLGERIPRSGSAGLEMGCRSGGEPPQGGTSPVGSDAGDDSEGEEGGDEDAFEELHFDRYFADQVDCDCADGVYDAAESIARLVVQPMGRRESGMAYVDRPHPATLKLYTYTVASVIRYWQIFDLEPQPLARGAWARAWDESDFFG